MIEYYSEIKSLHIVCVLLSGGLFTCRGLLMLANSAYTNNPVLKRLSYVNDSILLIAGIQLMVITQQYPIAQHWLSVKLLLLIVYIVLGVFALRAGRTRGQRTIFFIAALATYLFMFSIARGHHPLGLLATGSLF